MIQISYSVEYIRTILQTVYPIKDGIFKYLKPTEVSKLCVVLGIILREEEKYIYMNPVHEIYLPSKEQCTLLIFDVDAMKIVNYKEYFKSVHIHHIEECNLSYRCDKVVKRGIMYELQNSDNIILATVTNGYKQFDNIFNASYALSVSRKMNTTNNTSFTEEISCIVYKPHQWCFDKLIITTGERINNNIHFTMKLKNNTDLLSKQHKQIGIF